MFTKTKHKLLDEFKSETMSDLPQLFDAAPDLYESCVEMAQSGHGAGCAAYQEGVDITGCTCGLREALKAIAYARGDDPLKVDEGEYDV